MFPELIILCLWLKPAIQKNVQLIHSKVAKYSGNWGIWQPICSVIITAGMVINGGLRGISKGRTTKGSERTVENCI